MSGNTMPEALTVRRRIPRAQVSEEENGPIEVLKASIFLHDHASALQSPSRFRGAIAEGSRWDGAVSSTAGSASPGAATVPCTA